MSTAVSLYEFNENPSAQTLFDLTSSAAGFGGVVGNAYSLSYNSGKYILGPIVVKTFVSSKYGSEFSMRRAKW